jgi:hypothetical protein
VQAPAFGSAAVLQEEAGVTDPLLSHPQEVERLTKSLLVFCPLFWKSLLAAV